MENLESVNWLDKLKAFYKRHTLKPLSCDAQALFVYLFYRASEVMAFSVRISDPQLEGALRMGEARLSKARQELVDGGYLEHEDLRGNKPDGYTLLWG